MAILDWEKISFTIISYAGQSKSQAFDSIKKSKEGKFELANELLEQAQKNIIKAEKAHMEVIVAEARGQQLEFKVLYMHAEDQMLTAQMIIEIAKEMKDIWVAIKK